ncbi:hypothetical protein [Kitasatospora sp. NPDC048407]|uniref:hypothetical protein n=1 Tax=Kitasatospora sp. NPDC048407 TaxID=3364051 RepID=UPI003719F897
MNRKALAACALGVAVALGPAAVVLALAMLDPQSVRRWGWWFFALAVAMLGVVYGGDLETWWRRRRTARRPRLRITVHRVRTGDPP